jgi:two-component system sensor histidine kinase RegB
MTAAGPAHAGRAPTRDPQQPTPGALGGRGADINAGHRNLRQLVQLRWLAVAGQLLTIVGVHYGLGATLPLGEMLALLAALALFNAGCVLRGRLRWRVSNAELFGGLLIDVAVLGGQLYFSGGVANPFVFLFLLQVAVGAVMLERAYGWAMVAVASAAFVTLIRWHRPLPRGELAGIALSTDYVGALLICFLLNAVLLVLFIQRIMLNLRQRDAHLAALRQRAVEEEHIVRMGLLASGAAHELGTPLATLSVILSDWSHMAPFAADPELREEIEEMQAQLDRCTVIVAGILMSAGEARGVAPVHTTLHAFLDGVAQRWQRTRGAELHYVREALPDAHIISDRALMQMIENVLDNAHEAAPGGRIEFTARGDERELRLQVADDGPGFPPHMLERLGIPYQSSKGRPGGGLGLFLALNVARTLGGHIAARNRPQGGAEVSIALPLAALVPPEEEGDPQAPPSEPGPESGHGG